MAGNLASPPGLMSRARRPGEDPVRWAWISLAFYPLSLPVGFMVGLILLNLLGYAEDEATPLWAAVGVNVPAYLVFSVPGLLAVRFGRRAVQRGNRAGWLPAIIGILPVLAMIGLQLAGGAELP